MFNRYIEIKKDYVFLAKEINSIKNINDNDTFNSINFINFTNFTNFTDVDIQTGGGAWSSYSSGNDSTYDMLTHYNIRNYDSDTDKEIYFNDIKDTDKALTAMFKDYEKDLKKLFEKNTPKIKINDGIDFYDSPHNSNYLGIVTWMLESNYYIHVKWLQRILIHAYYEYFKIVTVREASGWKSWDDRKNCLIGEIRLINYAINTAKKNVAKINWDKKEVIYKEIDKIFKKNPEKVMDKIYIKHKKRKSKYSSSKYSIEPGVDARLLHVGTIMMGHNGKHNTEPFVVTLNNSNKKVWEFFDSWDSNFSNYLEDKYMIDLYGKEYYRIIRRPNIQNKKILK